MPVSEVGLAPVQASAPASVLGLVLVLEWEAVVAQEAEVGVDYRKVGRSGSGSKDPSSRRS